MSDYDQGVRDGANAAYRSILAQAVRWLIVGMVALGLVDGLAYALGVFLQHCRS